MASLFSSPEVLDNLWTYSTKVVGNVIPNRKEMPKEIFFKKLKKNEKIVAHRGHLLAIKWRDLQNVYILSIGRDNEAV